MVPQLSDDIQLTIEEYRNKLYQFIQNKSISSTAFNSRVRPASNISTNSTSTVPQTRSPVDAENDYIGTNYHQNYNNYDTKNYQYNNSTSTTNNNNNNYTTFSEQKKQLSEQQDNIINAKRKPLDEYQTNSNNSNNNNNNNQFGGVAAYTGSIFFFNLHF